MYSQSAFFFCRKKIVISFRKIKLHSIDAFTAFLDSFQGIHIINLINLPPLSSPEYHQIHASYICISPDGEYSSNSRLIHLYLTRLGLYLSNVPSIFLNSSNKIKITLQVHAYRKNLGYLHSHKFRIKLLTIF